MNTIKSIARQYPAALLFGLVSIGSMMGMIAARGTPWAYRFTVIASVSFVLAGLFGGAHKHGYGRFMALGLVLCCAGDLLGVQDFVWGALAFLLAHIAFLAAFLVQGVRWRTVAIAAVPATLTGIILGAWVLPHVPGQEWWLVISYIVVISLMVIVALGVRMPAGYGLLVAGALVFYVSDIFVARWQYVAPSRINAYFCYPLYYSACVLLALSIAARSVKSRT